MVNQMDHRNIAANIFTYSTTDLTAAALQPRTCAYVIYIAEQNKMNLFFFFDLKNKQKGDDLGPAANRQCRSGHNSGWGPAG
jgi:hypothetical protein